MTGRSRRESTLRTALRMLAGEWVLVAAGLPAVVILLGSSAGWYPTLTAIHAVLGINVAMLLGWGLSPPARRATDRWPPHSSVSPTPRAACSSSSPTRC